MFTVQPLALDFGIQVRLMLPTLLIARDHIEWLTRTPELASGQWKP